MRIIAGALGGRNLKTVEGPGYRPATAKVREAIFSMLSSRGVVWSGLRVLDLFAGSGSLSFEALSRGAQEVCLGRARAESCAMLEPECGSAGCVGSVPCGGERCPAFSAGQGVSALRCHLCRSAVW